MHHRYASVSPEEATNPLHPIERGSFQSPAGMQLTWHKTGQEGAPTLVLANGIGGNIDAWEHLVNYFNESFQVLSWDYRGLFDSEKPPTNDGYHIVEHARDLGALLDHHGVREPILIGWSMGAQVNFEFIRQRPGDTRGLIIINGTSGLPFQSAFSTSILDQMIPKLAGIVTKHWSKAAWLAPLVGDSKLTLPAMKALGLMGHTADERIFRRLAREYSRLDFGAWMEIFARMGLHDASDMLDRVNVPTLIIAGERDLFTPLPVARVLANRIPDAELYVVSSGTHYCPLEFPELVSLRVEKYLVEKLGLTG